MRLGPDTDVHPNLSDGWLPCRDIALRSGVPSANIRRIIQRWDLPVCYYKHAMYAKVPAEVIEGMRYEVAEGKANGGEIRERGTKGVQIELEGAAWLPVRTASRYLKKSHVTILRHVSNKTIVHKRVGKQTYVLVEPKRDKVPESVFSIYNAPAEELPVDNVIDILRNSDARTFHSTWPAMAVEMCSATSATLTDVAEFTTYVRARYEAEAKV